MRPSMTSPPNTSRSSAAVSTLTRRPGGGRTSRKRLCKLIELAGFLEQVGGAGNDQQALVAAEQGEGLAIEVDHHVVVADDQECGCGECRHGRGAGHGGPAAARDDGRDSRAVAGCQSQPGGGAGAGAEQAERQGHGERLGAEPGGGLAKPPGQQSDVETVLVNAIFVRAEQVEQEGADAGVAQARAATMLLRGLCRLLLHAFPTPCRQADIPQHPALGRVDKGLRAE